MPLRTWGWDLSNRVEKALSIKENTDIHDYIKIRNFMYQKTTLKESKKTAYNIKIHKGTYKTIHRTPTDQ